VSDIILLEESINVCGQSMHSIIFLLHELLKVNGESFHIDTKLLELLLSFFILVGSVEKCL